MISNTVGNVFPAQVLTALEEAPLGTWVLGRVINTRKPHAANHVVQEVRNLHQQCDFLLKSLGTNSWWGNGGISPWGVWCVWKPLFLAGLVLIVAWLWLPWYLLSLGWSKMRYSCRGVGSKELRSTGRRRELSLSHQRQYGWIINSSTPTTCLSSIIIYHWLSSSIYLHDQLSIDYSPACESKGAPPMPPTQEIMWY